MLEQTRTLQLRLLRALIVCTGAAAAIGLGVVLRAMWGRPAGATVLPTVPDTISHAVPPVSSTLDSAPGDVGTAVSDVVANPTPPAIVSKVVGTTGGVVASLSGTTGQVLPVAPSTPSLPVILVPPSTPSQLPIPALPVPSSPANLRGLVGQGPPTTALATPSLSATTTDDFSRTGSAALFSQWTPSRSVLDGGTAWPVAPRPAPGRPSAPALPLVTLGATSSSGSGLHGLSLDSLPPTILVLALLVGAGTVLERRRRPMTRFDLRFSPPG
jgi:hypothetical protein